MEDFTPVFIEIGNDLEGSVKGQMFGLTCFKINHKAYTCFFQNCMVFKLGGEAHKTAISLDGSVLFDPSGMGRRMKEWVQVPGEYKHLWPELAKAARTYVFTGVKV